MSKPIALFDIDNTLYDGFSYFELLHQNVQEGLLGEATLKQALAAAEKYQSQSQDYETTVAEVLDILARGLAGTEYIRALQAAQQFYRNTKKFYPYIRPLMAKLRVTHAVAIVTGEPQFVAQAVAGVLGIQTYFATELAVTGERFTGQVKTYLASRHAKHAAIQYLMAGHPREGSLAFGDSEGDIEMLRAVEHAICINATKGLKNVAAKAGWHLVEPGEVEQLVDRLLAARLV